MIVVSVIACLAGCPGKAGVIAVEVVRAEDALGPETGHTVPWGHVGDVVENAGWLGTVHEATAAPDEFDPVHHVEGRRVVGFGVPERIGMNRNSVFENLEKLHPVGFANPAVAEADQGCGFLGKKEARSHGEGLSVVVGLNLGQRIQVDHGGAFA